MYCEKCGKQLADGEVCDCDKATTPITEETPAAQETAFGTVYATNAFLYTKTAFSQKGGFDYFYLYVYQQARRHQHRAKRQNNRKRTKTARNNTQNKRRNRLYFACFFLFDKALDRFDAQN